MRQVWAIYRRHLLRAHARELARLGFDGHLDAAEPAPKGPSKAEARRLERIARSIREGVDENLKTIPGIRTAELLGGGSEGLIRDWRKTNVGLIKRVEAEHLERIEKTIKENANLHVAELRDKLQEEFGISESKARFWARDQTLKLNADLQQERQTRLGIVEYVWHATPDARTRPRHKELDGTRQRWDTPPEVAPGRHEHPGKDYQCRCYSEPILPGGEQLEPKPSPETLRKQARPRPERVRRLRPEPRPEPETSLPVPETGSAQESARQVFGGLAPVHELVSTAGFLRGTSEHFLSAQAPLTRIVERAGFRERRPGGGVKVRSKSLVGANACMNWDGMIEVSAEYLEGLQGLAPSAETIAKLARVSARVSTNKEAVSAADRAYWYSDEARHATAWIRNSATLLHEELHVCSPLTRGSYQGVGARLEEGLVEHLTANFVKQTGVERFSYLEEQHAIIGAIAEDIGDLRGVASKTAKRIAFDAAVKMWRSAEPAQSVDAYVDLFVRAVGPRNPARFRETLIENLRKVVPPDVSRSNPEK